jgi:hypothetical protein
MLFFLWRPKLSGYRLQMDWMLSPYAFCYGPKSKGIILLLVFHSSECLTIC